MSVKNMIIYYRTSDSLFSTTETKHIKLMEFDLSCQTSVKVCDLFTEKLGNITENFQNYTTEMNYHLIDEAFKGTYFLTDSPEEYIKERSIYPETTRCIQ